MMTVATAVYLLAVTLLLTLAAAIGEWLLERLKRTSRWVWVAALGLGILIPLLPTGPFSLRTAAFTRIVAPAVDNSVTIAAPSHESAAPAWSTINIPDGVLQALSIAVGTLFVFAWLALVVRARRWSRSSMDGTPVLVGPVRSPAVVGFVSPRIVVPQWAFDLEREQRRMLLAHEQSHIDARDPLLLLLGGVVVVLAAWNPCVWYALRRLRGAIEIDCDRRVLAGGASAERYAECLVESAARSITRGVTPVGSLALSSSFLERRIEIMVRTIRLSKVALGAGAALATGLVLLALTSDRPVAAATVPQQLRTEAAAIPFSEIRKTDRAAQYYGRLTAGQLTQTNIVWGVFNPDFSLNRPGRLNQPDGC